jgi:hypothetical protein
MQEELARMRDCARARAHTHTANCRERRWGLDRRRDWLRSRRRARHTVVSVLFFRCQKALGKMRSYAMDEGMEAGRLKYMYGMGTSAYYGAATP